MRWLRHARRRQRRPHEPHAIAGGRFVPGVTAPGSPALDGATRLAAAVLAPNGQRLDLPSDTLDFRPLCDPEAEADRLPPPGNTGVRPPDDRPGAPATLPVATATTVAGPARAPAPAPRTPVVPPLALDPRVLAAGATARRAIRTHERTIAALLDRRRN